MIAAQMGDKRHVAKLREHGGHVSLKDTHNRNAFHFLGLRGKKDAEETADILHILAGPVEDYCPLVSIRVERFGRRGTEPNELFRSEFGQNSWNRKKTTKNYFIEVASDQNSFKIQEFSLENSKIQKNLISTFSKKLAKSRENFITI